MSVADLEPRLEVIARAEPIDTLPAYERNSRTHSPEQIEELLASLIEFGWTQPVLADDEGIVAGHGRVEAAELGYGRGLTFKTPDGRPLPPGTALVIDCTGWSPDQRRAYIIADNRLAEKAGWDAGLLRIELGHLVDAGFDIGVTGFPTLQSIDDLLGPAVGGGDPIGTPPANNYQEQYAVIVVCHDQAEQKALYERFRDEKLGREVKVVST